MRDKVILMVPLDERPCNLYFPAIMPGAGYKLNMVPKELLGLKKRPADTDRLRDWVLKNAVNADYAILSLDTLVYGGLIPSRLHHTPEEELKKRAEILTEIKSVNPAIKVYAFMTIMRCPWYSLSAEEPDYYEIYGSAIHKYGKLIHREWLGILTETEDRELQNLKKMIDPASLSDFTERREINVNVLLHTLELVRGGAADGFIVPQDDSAPLGFTAMDQQRVREFIEANDLQLKVPVYPAADDTGMTMLARAVLNIHGARPKVYVYYASANGPFVTPSFEDRTVDATVKNQIRAAGCLRVYSMSECDIALMVNIGSEMVYEEDALKRAVPYAVERSLPEYIDEIEYALSLNKVVAVADVAYPTRSDFELLRLLRERELLLEIHAYAGWNTSSNTIGTVLCQSVLYLAGGDKRGNRDFLLHRYYDDVGYCSHTRTYVDVNVLPPLNLTVFELDGERGKCTQAARTELLRYMGEQFPSLAKHVKDVAVSSPWNRTFEMDFVLNTREETEEKKQ